MRTYVYVDALNLYYRGIKNTPHKWLDLKNLCQTILGANHQIKRIKYFTAKISGKIDEQAPLRQQTYIRALEKYIPELSVHYGHFLTHPAWQPLAKSPQEKVRILKTEEKGSDVNLAVHLLNDGWLENYDCAVIISNDSDLAEAMRIVRDERKKQIKLLLPPKCHPSRKLIDHSDYVHHIRSGVLSLSQLSNPIPETKIRKPDLW